MKIEDLAARCPPFTKVVFHMDTNADAPYLWADPGDVIHLREQVGGVTTGARITVMVLERVAPKSSAVRDVVRPHE